MLINPVFPINRLACFYWFFELSFSKSPKFKKYTHVLANAINNNITRHTTHHYNSRRRYSVLPFCMASNRASLGRTSSLHRSLANAPNERSSSRSHRRRHSSRCQQVLCDTSYSWRKNSDSGGPSPARRRRHHGGRKSVVETAAAACNRPSTNRTRSESPPMSAAVASAYTSHSNRRTASGPPPPAECGRRRWRPARHRPRRSPPALLFLSSAKRNGRRFRSLFFLSRPAP